MRCLRCQLFRWLVQLGRVELRKVARYALLQLGAAPFHLPACEVLVAGIDRLELAAVDRNTRGRQQQGCDRRLLARAQCARESEWDRRTGGAEIFDRYCNSK